MKESYSEGIASHTGPESCAASREAIGEALTGVRAGQDIEPRKVGKFVGADAHHRAWKATICRPSSRGRRDPRAVVDPVHVRKLLAREPGELVCGLAKMVARSALLAER